MTHAIERAERLVSAACMHVAMLSVAVLFAVVALSILARWLFDLSGGAVNLLVPGAVELVSYALLIAVFAAIPAALRNGLIRVDVLMERFPAGLTKWLDRLWFVVLSAFALVLLRLFAQEALAASRSGQVTQDWRFPLWIIHSVITLECAAFAFVALARTVARGEPR